MGGVDRHRTNRRNIIVVEYCGGLFRYVQANGNKILLTNTLTVTFTPE